MAASDDMFTGTRSPINFKVGGSGGSGSSKSPGKSVMDFRSSPGLAAGLKRVGGRNGTARLGKSPISTESKHGRLRISHKY